MIEKNDIYSSNSPKCLPPFFAMSSPNLSHVQWGRVISLAFVERISTPSVTRPKISKRNSWNADLQRPKMKLVFKMWFARVENAVNDNAL